MTILPPIAKRKRYPALTLTVLHARDPCLAVLDLLFEEV